MRIPLRLARAATALAFVATAPPLAAQQKASHHIVLEQYLDWEDVQAPQLSPDGTQIIFTRRWVDKMNDKWESSVWLMNADGSHSRQLVQGGDVTWSPDGKRIAYVAKGEPSGQQIFIRWMDAEGAATQISHLTESPSGLEWSPDGKSIAFTMNVAWRDTFRIAMPAPPKGAKWVEPPKIVSRLNYRSDRVGFTDGAYRHIFVIPADGGTPRQITSGDFDHSGASFSADGKWLAFSGNLSPNAEDQFRTSHVYAANIETGEVRQLTHRAGTSGGPQYSPRRETDRVHGGRFGRPFSLGALEAVDDERRRLERPRRVGESRPSHLGRDLGARRQRRVLQCRERRVEEPLLRDAGRAVRGPSRPASRC